MNSQTDPATLGENHSGNRPIKFAQEQLAMLSPYLRHCGMPTRPPWHLGKRKLLDYLLHAVEEGSGKLIIEGVSTPLEAGDLFWIPPNTEHEIIGTSSLMVCPYLHFDLIYRADFSHWHFDIEEGASDLSSHGDLMHPPLPEKCLFHSFRGVIRNKRNRVIISWIKALYLEAATSKDFVEFHCSGYLYLILGELLRIAHPSDGHESDSHEPTLEMAMSYVKKHFSQNELNVNDLAKFCQISPSQLRAIFKEHLQSSPQKYIRQFRSDVAKELMAQADFINLSQIAERVGYSCIHSFSRAFKEIEGLSPSEYRRFNKDAVSTEHRTQLKGKMDVEDYCERQKLYRKPKK